MTVAGVADGDRRRNVVVRVPSVITNGVRRIVDGIAVAVAVAVVQADHRGVDVTRRPYVLIHRSAADGLRLQELPLVVE